MKFVYDDTGKQIEKSWYDADDTIEGKKKFLYDEKGNLIEIDFTSQTPLLNGR